MTPEPKKAHIAQQQEEQELIWKTVITIFGAGGDSNSSTSQQGGMSDQDKWNRDHQYQAPVSQPVPVTPIGGNSGIYGSCHNASCP
jgi:hypothetical protein